MGVNHLWDSNTAIYHLQGQFSTSAEAFIQNLLAVEQPVLASISDIELLSWRNASLQDLQAIEIFISNCVLLELEKAIRSSAAALRRQHRIKTPDAVVAATALVYDLTLLTRNTADFKNIQGLKLINPWDQ